MARYRSIAPPLLSLGYEMEPRIRIFLREGYEPRIFPTTVTGSLKAHAKNSALLSDCLIS